MTELHYKYMYYISPPNLSSRRNPKPGSIKTHTPDEDREPLIQSTVTYQSNTTPVAAFLFLLVGFTTLMPTFLGLGLA